ncbi:MAG: hypothetical protein AAGA99_02805 [Actinomycetota bacterium]
MGRRAVVLLIVLAILAAACSSDSSEDAAPDTTVAPAPSTAPPTTQAPTTTTSTTTTTTTTLPVPEAETDVEVLAAYVESQSGIEFPPGVASIVETTHEETDLGIDPGWFIREELWALFVSLGMIDPEADRITAGQARLDQVRGVCCPVYLFEQPDHPLLTSMVAVHELAHLLDREREFRAAGPQDEPLNFDSVVLEGNAQRVAYAYRAELIAAGADLSMFDLDWTDPRIPPVIIEVLEFAYEEGADFTIALHERGGLELVEETFLRPPATSEQVLEIDAYLADEPAAEVAAPSLPDTAAPILDGSMGAFVLRLIIEGAIGVEAAGELVEAWAGDRYVLYEDAGVSCISARVELDDAVAAEGIAEALVLSGYEPVVDDTGTGVALSHCAGV